MRMRRHLAPKIAMHFESLARWMELVEMTKVPRFGCSSLVHLLQQTLSGGIPIRDWISNLVISSVT